MFKILILVACCLLVAVSAQYWGGEGGYGGEYEDHHHSHPKYKYEYGVKDHHTGDHKSQWEHRDGDVVKGGYTLDEADGTKRVVEYHSDKHHGLQAHVKRIGHAHHPQVYGHHGGHYEGHGHGSGYSYSNLHQHF
ncbi:cuticle protein 19-like [Topomyia yanbarensis]|uniref:cuticle protein 19-like n=1 Tax=Topomyia yanbarensis TaxID=2498891 RepID=UPI00273CE3F9|nr:cuticle protein 19-like [Topomyia yanbarensis]